MAAILEPLECPLDDVARVPRRFGVGVLMMLMTAFAVLFAIMRTFSVIAPTFGVSPAAFCVIAGLFLAVTLAQILLFEGKKPREASLLAGAVVFPLEIAAAIIWSAMDSRQGSAEPRGSGSRNTSARYLAARSAATWPAASWRACFSCRRTGAGARASGGDQSPAVDRGRFRSARQLAAPQAALRGLWSQGQLSFPLDPEQLEDRFASAMPASAELCGDEAAATAPPAARAKPRQLVYKAVCGEMQEMVGMVELANIDYERSRANIESGDRRSRAERPGRDQRKAGPRDRAGGVRTVRPALAAGRGLLGRGRVAGMLPQT